jgi:hypothetical protein
LISTPEAPTLAMVGVEVTTGSSADVAAEGVLGAAHAIVGAGAGGAGLLLAVVVVDCPVVVGVVVPEVVDGVSAVVVAGEAAAAKLGTAARRRRTRAETRNVRVNRRACAAAFRRARARVMGVIRSGLGGG